MTVIIEHVSRAVHSNDLSHKTTRCDVDYLQGLGMATRNSRLGSVLIDIDLKYSPKELMPALNEVMKLVYKIAKKNRWEMTPVKCRRIARDALNIYIRPPCQCCKGRGMIGVEPDKPGEYRPRPCSECGGLGFKDLPNKHNREVREALYVMHNARGGVERRVRRVIKK